MRPISEYTSYREFIKDRFGYLKTIYASFSHRKFSQLAGLGSPNYLILITSGQRNLGPQAALKFVKGLQLTEPEAQVFLALVRAEAEKQFVNSWHGIGI